MIRSILITAAAASLAVAASTAAVADETSLESREIKHVLLISVDGLHALDLSNFVATHADSALAELGRHGITYSNNSTSSPSDSFPGLASLVTGGSPVTTGLWYDDTYNRALSPPAQTDGLGNPGGSCPGKIGTNVAWDEAVDIDLTRLDAGGGLNPKFLVRNPNNGCKTILPRKYSCGRMVLQPLLGFRTRNFGLRPPPASSRVRSMSTASSHATLVPILAGQLPPGLPRPSVCAGGDSARL